MEEIRNVKQLQDIKIFNCCSWYSFMLKSRPIIDKIGPLYLIMKEQCHM